ncbi:MAG: YraN family protein [Thermodesulfobacteriota bacterium]|nr:YraN family protein [Thermodesulfobacteriota bacterium]
MPSKRQIFGKKAEDAACLFLDKLGFKILERNYRTRAAEIDIIAQHGDFLVFIEVKARQGLQKGTPGEAVNFSKQKKISLGAAYYLKEKKIDNVRVRFDVVAICSNNGRFAIELIENAFQALI